MSEDLTKKLLQSDSDKLSVILTTVQSLDQRSMAAETQFGTFDARLEKLEIRLDNVSSRLQNLERNVRQRLYDTRPMWHKVVADISQLQSGQQRLEEGQFVLNDAIRKIHRDFHDIDERLQRLELSQNSST
jgi:hypothetical protein